MESTWYITFHPISHLYLFHFIVSEKNHKNDISVISIVKLLGISGKTLSNIFVFSSASWFIQSLVSYLLILHLLYF